MSRIRIPTLSIVVMIGLAGIAVSVGAQSVRSSIYCPVPVMAVPEARDIRSIYIELNSDRPFADIFAVPLDKLFVITDVVFSNAGDGGQVIFREDGASGPVRAGYVVEYLYTGSGAAGSLGNSSYSLRSGLVYGPGTTVSLERPGARRIGVTISGYLAEP